MQQHIIMTVAAGSISNSIAQVVQSYSDPMLWVILGLCIVTGCTVAKALRIL